MTDEELETVAKQWVSYQQAEMRSPEELELRPTIRSWSRLCWEDPESLWKLILIIIRTDDTQIDNVHGVSSTLENALLSA